MSVRSARLFSGALVLSLVVALCIPGLGVALEKDPGVSPQQVISIPPDAWESNDSTATAKVVPNLSFHTLDHGDDEDWFKLTVTAAGTEFTFETQHMDGNNYFDSHMYLYELNPDGTVTELESVDDHDYLSSYSQYLRWTAPAPGTYFLMIRGHGDDDTGHYRLYWEQGVARRVSGENRFETANEVSRLIYQQMTSSYNWGFSLEGVVIASGQNYADGLAGAMLAAAIDSPLLLSRATGLDAATKAEVARLLRTQLYYEDEDLTIYLLGGPSAVPTQVEADLRSLPEVQSALRAGQLTIKRLAGADRFGTAAAIAREVDDIDGVSSTAYVVNGFAWPDALAVTAPSVYWGSPILLTRLDSIPGETLAAITDLGITEVVIVGGPPVVSAAVQTQLTTLLGAGNVSRLAGINRYETALEVARHAVDDLGMESDALILVSGENWPDALAAGPLVYSWNDGYGTECPIMITRSTFLSGEVKTFINEYGPLSDLSYVVGGPPAVSAAVMQQLGAYKPAP